jgi:hypothetical protein
LIKQLYPSARTTLKSVSLPKPVQQWHQEKEGFGTAAVTMSSLNHPEVRGKSMLCCSTESLESPSNNF